MNKEKQTALSGRTVEYRDGIGSWNEAEAVDPDNVEDFLHGDDEIVLRDEDGQFSIRWKLIERPLFCELCGAIDTEHVDVEMRDSYILGPSNAQEAICEYCWEQ